MPSGQLGVAHDAYASITKRHEDRRCIVVGTWVGETISNNQRLSAEVATKGGPIPHSIASHDVRGFQARNETRKSTSRSFIHS